MDRRWVRDQAPLYTGIAPACSWFSQIAEDEKVLLESVVQRVVRASGLAERLWP